MHTFYRKYRGLLYNNLSNESKENFSCLGNTKIKIEKYLENDIIYIILNLKEYLDML